MSTSNGEINISAGQPGGGQGSRAITGLTGMYLLVACAVSCSWLIGFFTFSFVWSFLLIAGLFVVWKAKISKIIKQHLSVEETALYRRRAFQQNETVEWLNFLLNRWWVFSSYTIEHLIKKRLDERLWDIKPQFLDSLELTTFNTGEETPTIRNVRVFEFCEGVQGGHKPLTWFNISKPPAGLDKMSTYQLLVQGDVQLMAEDFKMIFRARVGMKKVNIGFDIAVEDLQMSGTLQTILHMSMDVPFPHITKATMSFCEKPDVTFNLRMMKTLQIMEVPLLKSWIHTNVMEGFTKAMVDPAAVDLKLASTGPVQISSSTQKQSLAQGVLTIHVKGKPPKEPAAEEIRYTVLRIGDLKRQTHDVPATDEWDDVCSFFVNDLGNEELLIKSKCKRLLTSTTLEQTSLNLSSFPFQVQSFAEKTIKHKDESQLLLNMQYTALPVIDLETAEVEKRKKVTEMAGVMYVCIHGASNVTAADKTGASDPYCVLFCNRRRLLTTPYVPATRNPRWETWVEFFVGDFSQNTYSFFVYDWDGSSTIDDDFLGAAHLSLRKEETTVVKRTLTLGYNRPDEGFVSDKACGQITISAIFRPVASVAKSERFRDLESNFKPSDYLYTEDLVSPSSVGDGRRSLSASAFMKQIMEDKLIAELTILQGRDLVAMDRNGFSDPFCVVSCNGKKVFTSSVKKKTLFPKWNEQVTVEIRKEDSVVTIDVFDKDMISKDFLGKITLTVDKLKELSIKDDSEWLPLERTKRGDLQLKCHVISKDMVRNGSYTANGTVGELSENKQKLAVPALVIGNTHLSSDNSNGSPSRGTNSSRAPMNSLGVRRSGSDISIEKVGKFDSLNGSTLPQESLLIRRQSAPIQAMKQNISVNSADLARKDYSDSASVNESIEKDGLNTPAETVDSSLSVSDKLFSVTGTVHRARGLPAGDGDIYCKVRLELPGSRTSLFSGSRVIGKSKILSPTEPAFDIKFEVDRGSGVSPDAALVFDIKRSSKEHVATKTFTLRNILLDSGDVHKWLPMGNNVELEVSLSCGQPTPHVRRRKIFKNLSFRKDK